MGSFFHGRIDAIEGVGGSLWAPPFRHPEFRLRFLRSISALAQDGLYKARFRPVFQRAAPGFTLRSQALIHRLDR